MSVREEDASNMAPSNGHSERKRSPLSRSASKSPVNDRDRSRYSRSRSNSRGRERSNRKRDNKKYSRSRSRSYSPYVKSRRRSSHSHRRGGRSRSYSPMSSRKRHLGNRENPKATRCVGVFGLSLYTHERDIRAMFDKYGEIEDVQLVYDRQTGRSRGFCFIYYKTIEGAAEAKEQAAGMELDGARLRVDFSITQRAHTPTPGIYLGKPSSRSRSGYREYRRPQRRTPSPYYRRSRYSRSRSRSYSPRRY